jgi:hypothetical protein
MIRLIDAAEFRGLASGGRNEPLRVLGTDSGGQGFEVYLKPSGRPEFGIESSCNELLATLLAGELGLPVCEPILVRLSPDWIATIDDPELQSVLRQSGDMAFSSRSAGLGWKLWSSGESLLLDRRPKAIEIFAFDAFTGNADRRDQKPNLLVRGSDFRMIDHEMCFGLSRKLFPRVAPWELGNLTPLARSEHHIFGPLLKGCKQAEFADVRASWSALKDDRLADFEACIPAQLQAAAPAMADAVAHVKNVRDRIDECITEVERVLT